MSAAYENKALLDDLLRFLEQKGVTTRALDLYAQAKAMAVDAQTTMEQDPDDYPDGHTPWDEFEMQKDAVLDGGCFDYCEHEFEQLAEAMAAVWGPKP
jgi:hypothetical protein